MTHGSSLCLRMMPPPSHTVRSFVCYQTWEHDILKTSEPISMPIDTSRQRGTGMKRSTLGSEIQRSRSHEVEDRFGGMAEAFFSTSRVD